MRRREGAEREEDKDVSLKPPSRHDKCLTLDDGVGYETHTHTGALMNALSLSLCVCACLGERGEDKRVQSFIFILKFDLACLIYQVVIFVAGSCHSSMNILVKLLS